MKEIIFSKNTFLVVHNSGFFFRIAGKGVSIDVNRPKLFSERNGFRKVRRIGRISLEVLK